MIIKIEVYSRLKDATEEDGGMYSYYNPTEVAKIFEDMQTMNRVVVSSCLTDEYGRTLNSQGLRI